MRKKNIETVISAMGALLSVVVDLVKFIREFKGEPGQCLYRLAQPEGKQALQKIAQLMVDAAHGTSQAVYHVEINHSLSREQLLREGAYDHIDSDFTEENVLCPPKTSKRQSVLNSCTWAETSPTTMPPKKPRSAAIVCPRPVRC